MLSIGRNRSFKAVGAPLLIFFFFSVSTKCFGNAQVLRSSSAAALCSHSSESLGESRWLRVAPEPFLSALSRAGVHLPFPGLALLIGCYELDGVGAESCSLLPGH